jgi:hypothetical protein
MISFSNVSFLTFSARRVNFLLLQEVDERKRPTIILLASHFARSRFMSQTPQSSFRRTIAISRGARSLYSRLKNIVGLGKRKMWPSFARSASLRATEG